MKNWLTESNAIIATVILVLLTTIFRIFFATVSGLGIGESYYYLGARELALSYFDQPPMFFWLSGACIRLFGDSALALRLPSIVLFAGSCWLLYLITRRLFSSRAGFLAVLVLNLSAVFTIPIAVWYQPDAALLFFWLAAAYGVVRIYFPKSPFSNTEAWVWWLFTGVMLGLAILSKYHIAFLILGVFIFTLQSAAHRRWLKHPAPYVAIFICLLMALPIVIWNAQNGWASFVFQGARAGSGGEFSLHPEWLLRSIVGQALWILPWVWIPLIVVLYSSFKQRNRDFRYGFIFWTSVLPIIFFTVVTLWSDLLYHFHWQVPGYLMLIIPFGAKLDEAMSEVKKGVYRWILLSSLFTVFSVVLIGGHMITGFWTYYGPKWVANQLGETIDPTMDGVDFLEIQQRFEQEGWLKDTNIAVGAPKWWVAGKVDWALRGSKPVVVFNRDSRNFAYGLDPRTLIGKDFIFIGRDHSADICWNGDPFFDSLKVRKDIIIHRNGVPEMRLNVFYGFNFHLPKEPREDFPLYRQLMGRKPFGN